MPYSNHNDKIQWGRDYYQKNKKEFAIENHNYYLKNKNKILKQMNKYNKSEKGKIRDAKHKAKRKKLGFNLPYENIINERFQYHHINNKNVVAIPEDLHQLYISNNLINHRFMVNQIVKQIYK